MTEIMFETFEVPAFYLANQAVLSLFSSGKSTGLVLDAGDSVTHIVPVFEGHAILHTFKRIALGGADLTYYMRMLLKEVELNLTSQMRNILRKAGENFSISADFETFDDIKAKNA
jgi:actin